MRDIRRAAGMLLAIAACMAVFWAVAPSQSRAQENQPAAAAEADTAPPADAKVESQQKNRLVWIIECSGLIGLVILILSVYFVTTVTRLFAKLRLNVAAPPELLSQCEALLQQRDFKGIYNAVKDDQTFFGRLLTTGISELPNGLAEARDAIERHGDAITADMEKSISMLAVIGTLGPMIGLLGTLKGMITSFSAIALSSGVQLDAGRVANGISEALLLTFEGVALSVPAIYFYALFRNRIIHISTSVMLTADQFLRHFSHAGRAKTPPAVPPARSSS